jgi:hypothetical protein
MEPGLESSQGIEIKIGFHPTHSTHLTPVMRLMVCSQINWRQVSSGCLVARRPAALWGGKWQKLPQEWASANLCGAF